MRKLIHWLTLSNVTLHRNDRIRHGIKTSSPEEKQDETKLAIPNICSSNSAAKNSNSIQQSNVSSTTSKKIKTEDNHNAGTIIL